ncbi:MAG: hypothetical protein Q4G26_11670 [Paracoccus sp. (in: a-proteobacteria)]|nr:hypothetical protein [Paracoccus sp. (in: a-proteobacteria)]
MTDYTISHVAVGLYQGRPMVAVVVGAGGGARPRAGQWFSLAGQDWQIRAVADSHAYDPDPAVQAASGAGLVALVVTDGEALLPDQQRHAGQRLRLSDGPALPPGTGL